MIIAFCDDAVARLYATEQEAIREWEGVDVEGENVRFFRDDGSYLATVFSTPNRYGRFLWLFPWSESGEYALVPAPEPKDDPLWVTLMSIAGLEARFGIETVAQLKDLLRANGATVDQPPTDASR